MNWQGSDGSRRFLTIHSTDILENSNLKIYTIWKNYSENCVSNFELINFIRWRRIFLHFFSKVFTSDKQVFSFFFLVVVLPSRRSSQELSDQYKLLKQIVILVVLNAILRWKSLGRAESADYGSASLQTRLYTLQKYIFFSSANYVYNWWLKTLLINRIPLNGNCSPSKVSRVMQN